MSVHRRPPKVAEEALSVLLQHRSFDTNSSMLCSMSGVCRTWQAAVQQLQAGQLVISYTADSQQPVKSMSRLTSMLSWLSKYPSLITTLDVKLPDDRDLYEAVEQLLAFGLKQAMAVGCSPGSMARRTQQLQLQHLTATSLVTPRLLTALPLSSLRSLSIIFNEDSDWCPRDTPAWGRALGAFTGLRSLVLAAIRYRALPSDCLDHISVMSQLSHLRLNWVDGDGTDGLRQIPASLQELVLAVDMNVTNKEPGSVSVIDIQHLTALTQLSLESYGPPPLSEHLRRALPEHLQVLQVGQWAFDYGFDAGPVASLPHLHLTKLQLLTELCLSCVKHESSEDLMPIAGMTALQQLELWHDSLKAATTAAPAWKQLPQLKRIRIMPGVYESFRSFDLNSLMEQLGAATSLTALQLKAIGNDVEVCKYITGLSRLQELLIELPIQHDHVPDLVEVHVGDDALQLRGLTALTHLLYGPVDDPRQYSGNAGIVEGMGDVAAVALACQLTNLRHWKLSRSSLTTAAVVPAIGLHLKHLTELDLRDNHYKFSVKDAGSLLSYNPRLRVHV